MTCAAVPDHLEAGPGNTNNPVVVQSLSPVGLVVTPMDCSTPGLPVPHHIVEFAQVHAIESVTLSNHLTLCYTLLLLPSVFPSIRVFSNQSVHHIRWPKYWNFSISISVFNKYSGLISFRIDSLDLLAVQGTLKSLLLHHSSKAPNFWHSAFTVQHSHPYMTTGKKNSLD